MLGFLHALRANVKIKQKALEMFHVFDSQHGQMKHVAAARLRLASKRVGDMVSEKDALGKIMEKVGKKNTLARIPCKNLSISW